MCDGLLEEEQTITVGKDMMQKKMCQTTLVMMQMRRDGNGEGNFGSPSPGIVHSFATINAIVRSVAGCPPTIMAKPGGTELYFILRIKLSRKKSGSTHEVLWNFRYVTGLDQNVLM